MRVAENAVQMKDLNLVFIDNSLLRIIGSQNANNRE
jgi:hypothetical protein